MMPARALADQQQRAAWDALAALWWIGAAGATHLAARWACALRLRRLGLWWRLNAADAAEEAARAAADAGVLGCPAREWAALIGGAAGAWVGAGLVWLVGGVVGLLAGLVQAAGEHRALRRGLYD